MAQNRGHRRGVLHSGLRSRGSNARYLRFSSDEPVGEGHDHGSTNKVSQADPEDVVTVERQRTVGISGEDAYRVGRHVGNDVLEARGDKCGDGNEDQRDLRPV